MSNELRSLLARVEKSDPDTAKELRRHIDALQNRRQFGLNFERHTPESVELTGRPISVGDTVRFLPPRGQTRVESDVTWTVVDITGPTTRRVAALVDPKTDEETTRSVEDLVYVADFRDPIYPGLKRSDEPVTRGGDKPFHTVINAENYHALEALMFTHQGKIDCIYIDPPYNTRANDWKYNNDYVDPGDSYAHSKWLAFMERRLKLARKLLNPRDSVLIVTIDEKEHLRLGLLLEQTFPEANIQMISSVMSPSGVPRNREFTRVNEFIFFVMMGTASPSKTPDDMLFTEKRTKKQNRSPIWNQLRRLGAGPARRDSPSKFYPVLVDAKTGAVVGSGAPLPATADRGSYSPPPDLEAAWPTQTDGSDGRWELNRTSFEARLSDGYIRTTGRAKSGGWSIQYLRNAQIERLASGELITTGRTPQGWLDIDYNADRPRVLYAKTTWNKSSHDARTYGSWVLRSLIPRRKFPFPKSLYAVEDSLRFFIGDKPDAIVLDFFSGSGTTAHAVMRLNNQDDGQRHSISITNNEVSAKEQKDLIKEGLRPGDPDWEALGICDYITRPRLEAAVTGKTPEGEPIKGDYKFVDEFPMSEGFEENVEFFTLTYENPALIELDLAFERIAPLLWMRAGSRGRRIESRSETFDVADTYAVLFDVDASQSFLTTVEKTEGLRIAYVVTDDETQFQAVASQLPDDIESVRLYESYLRTFQINTGRA